MPEVNEEARKSVNIYDESAEVTDYDFYFNGVKLTVTVSEED